jgi:hypothetical protein
MLASNCQIEYHFAGDSVPTLDGARVNSGPLYKMIAARFAAWQGCKVANNSDWLPIHQDCINDLDFLRSDRKHLVITFPYHAMKDSGMYAGWFDYTLYIYPDLVFNYTLSITGPGSRGVVAGIKDYFYDLFRESLDTVINESISEVVS